MRILHIIDSGGLYGAEVMLLNLVDEQIKLGLDPIICSIGTPDIQEKPLETEAIKRGFKIKKVRMIAGPNFWGAWKILKFAHQESFDLIHTHGYKGNILFGFIPKKIRKIPLVSTLHGWTNTGGFTRMKLYKWLDNKSIKFIDAVVLVNKAMLSNPKLKKYTRDKFHIINNGIPILDLNNTSSDYELDSEITAFCREGFVVGSLGRLSPEKGFEYLIEAIYLLRNKIDNLKLIIIGEGPQKKLLREKINSLNLAGKIYLPSYRKSGSRYLPFFDIFVLPSLTEGLPITLLEAMMAKVPIIATKVGGIPEVLHDGKGGMIVEPKDPESLAEAIFSIYDKPELSGRIVSFSCDEVNTKYSSKTMARRYLEIYRRFVK